jgi:hypothetical protein
MAQARATQQYQRSSLFSWFGSNKIVLIASLTETYILLPTQDTKPVFFSPTIKGRWSM